MSLLNQAKSGIGALCLLAAVGAAASVSAPAQAQTPNSAAVTVLHTFNGSTEGYTVPGAPTLGADGKYVVPLQGGGINNGGALVEVGTDGTASVLHSFLDSSVPNDGNSPPYGVLLGSDGNYYGTANSGGSSASVSGGGGTLFKITPAGVETVLHQFSDGTAPNDGYAPNSELLQDSSGNLYGTTYYGGAGGKGTIFEYSPTTGQETILHSFQDGTVANDGRRSSSGLAFGPDGDLYGLSPFGGTTAAQDQLNGVGFGVAFKIDPSGQNYTILHDFSDGTVANDARYLQSKLLLAADGYFYGVGNSGGSTVAADPTGYGYGVVFRMATDGTVTILHSFGDGSVPNDGHYTYAPLTAGPDGTLYGDCINGGSTIGNPDSNNGGDGYGTLFSYKPSTGQYRLLYSFGTDAATNPGTYPQSAVAVASDASLYGGTGGDLVNNAGVFYHAVVPPAPVRFDFNQDGNADLIWYNTVSGGVSVWDMNDQSVLQYGGTFTQLDPSSGWVPVATPDVNGDGYPDLLWWNSQTGELSIWTLQGTTVLNYGADFGQISDTNWKPVAVGDDNGTTWNLVFQNSATGDISRWAMNGTTVTAYGGSIGSSGAGSGWQVVGAPDLDGDGKSDLLFWNSNTGEVSYWSMDLTNSINLTCHGDIAQCGDTSWHLMGSEDTNSDGQSDLIWWNANSGAESRWLMSGATVTAYGGTATQVGDTTWQPTAIR